MCDMALTSGDPTRHLQKLAALVAQRRVALGFASKEAAAEACGISHTTYRKVEFGQPVRGTTYVKLEVGFGFRPGSVRAILDGTSDSITLEDGTELIEGGQIRAIDPKVLGEGVESAVTKSALLVAPELTGRQIQQLSEQVAEELRRRGLLP